MNLQSELKPQHTNHLRADVAWALFQILENGKSSRDVLPIGISRQSSALNKRWFQECLYGCLRELPKLQFWTHLLLDKPMKKNTKVIEHLIIQGMYQIHFMRTPDHAAISETVAATKLLKLVKLSGLVNAVLRNFIRNKIAETPAQNQHIEYSQPKWFLKLVQRDYPENWTQIVIESNKKAPVFLRVNLKKIPLERFSQACSSRNIEHEIISERAVKLISNHRVEEIPGFKDGHIIVQDLAAQNAARILDIKVDEVVLDCCAAPGGKTTAFYEHMPKLKFLYAMDNSPKRLELLKDNLSRLGHVTEKIKVLLDDASNPGNLPDDLLFDRIFIDAPCSATGIIRRHPDIKWLRKKTDIEALISLQSEILSQMWQRLKEGGTLVYATCSILAAENKLQITKFLHEHKDAQLLPIHIEETLDNPGWQILPGYRDMDGFYYARLQKNKAT